MLLTKCESDVTQKKTKMLLPKRIEIISGLFIFVFCVLDHGVFGAKLNDSNESRHASSLIHNTLGKEMHIEGTHRYTEPQKLEMKSELFEDNKDSEGSKNYLLSFLADMKSGTKVFQHFFMQSNLSQLVEGM